MSRLLLFERSSCNFLILLTSAEIERKFSSNSVFEDVNSSDISSKIFWFDFSSELAKLPFLIIESSSDFNTDIFSSSVWIELESLLSLLNIQNPTFAMTVTLIWIG